MAQLSIPEFDGEASGMTIREVGSEPGCWEFGWRARAWAELGKPWDIIVIGGGITGAGIVREAARAGLRVLLVEANDFSAGTSSRSGKMVHGGLRYLQSGQIRLTIESVAERERLLRQGRGLITSQSFLLPSYATDRPPMWVFNFGLTVYDLLALKWGHRSYPPGGLLELCPQLGEKDLVGGFRFFDAQTDDSRLVLRVLREAVRAGAVVLNYTRADELLRCPKGEVKGIALTDASPDGRERCAEVFANVVINATGAWADTFRVRIGRKPKLRMLRGSHLIFPWPLLPLARAVTFLHPSDHRPLYALPWESVVLVGTTDVDHGPRVEIDPAIGQGEVDYLLDGLKRCFPGLELDERDVQATFAGVRAVVNTGNPNPSKESREFVLWNEDGLLTVTGGKLTTFRLMAHNALRTVRRKLSGSPRFSARDRVLDALPLDDRDYSMLNPSTRLRLFGRYGSEARVLIAGAQPGELEPIGTTVSLWAELRWAARAESVIHLEDLLLRRVRLGLQAPRGGLDLLGRVRAIVQHELCWDDSRWEKEAADYAQLWQTAYSLPAH